VTFRARFRVGLWAALLLAPCASALAASGDADAAFARGTRAYQSGDNLGAAEAFEQAYRLSPHGVAKYSAALAWEAGRDLPRAADDYRAALDSGQLDEHQRADAEKRLARLERQLGRIEVTAPAGTTIRVAHVAGATAPLTVHVAPGTHEIVAHFSDGRESTTRARVGAGETLAAAVELPAKRSASRAPPPSVTGPVERDAPAGGTQRTLGFIVAGGGVVASLAAVYLGTRALSARDEFVDSGLHDQDAHDQAASLRTATNVTWGVAGVLGAAGTVLILTAPQRTERPPAAGVSIVLGPAGASCAGRF
jgi:tetratricopeptide (TPR) repeat protein